MSVLITYAAELPQKFFSPPIEFNAYFAITNDYQKYCFNNNLFILCSIGVVGKEAMLIHDIFFHLLAGSVKLSLGGIKGLCAIPAGAFGLETDHQRRIKEGIVHFGFSLFYVVDFFLSLSNIKNSYPQDLLQKIEKVFTTFLETTNKKVLIIDNPETEKALRETQAEAEAKAFALKLEQKKAQEQKAALAKMQEELEKERNSSILTVEDIEAIQKKCKEEHRELEKQRLADTHQSFMLSEKPDAMTKKEQECSQREKPTPTNYYTLCDWSEDEVALLEKIKHIQQNQENSLPDEITPTILEGTRSYSSKSLLDHHRANKTNKKQKEENLSSNSCGSKHAFRTRKIDTPFELWKEPH